VKIGDEKHRLMWRHDRYTGIKNYNTYRLLDLMQYKMGEVTYTIQ